MESTKGVYTMRYDGFLQNVAKISGREIAANMNAAIEILRNPLTNIHECFFMLPSYHKSYNIDMIRLTPHRT